VTTLIDRLGGHGLLLVILNVLVEQIGAPLPAEPSLIIAGSLTVSGRLRLPELFGASIAGMLAADATWYLLGRGFGRPLLNLVSRLLRGREVRLGLRSIAVTKFIPGGMMGPALAGAMSYSFWRFVAYDLLAAALWSSVWIGLGLVFHDRVTEVLRVLDELLWPMLIIAAVIGGAFALWKARAPLARLVGRLGSG
jgi:membrane protein DedA with SNARE-associated domain